MSRSAHERDAKLEASDIDSLLERARRSYKARAWDDAVALFQAADALAPLAVDDLEQLALAAALIARDDLHLKTHERIYHACVEAGDARRAARAGFWLGFRLMPLGERARAQAWFARAQRTLEGLSGEHVEAGYLLLPTILLKAKGGELDAADQLANEARAIAHRFKDADLIALSSTLHGRVLLGRGEIERGLALFDEAMLWAADHELSPPLTGIIYCHVISACTQVWALDRAREWTAALSEWCDAQPQLRAFAGPCLVHRAELMELNGDWTSSIDAARMAAERTVSTNDPVAAATALYQQAEIHRLRGEEALADAGYSECSKRGIEPLPGLALLRLAQGKTEAAASAMRRVVASTADRLQRTRYLPAHVQIMLAIGALDEAKAGADELEAIAAAYGGEVLLAKAQHARAAVLLAQGNARAAVQPLREALLTWQRIGAPYIAARIHGLLAQAFDALGDCDCAALERGWAREAFEQLGAAPDLAALGAQPAVSVRPLAPAAPNTYGLSPRELQVLKLVASGKTNRAIAGELFLSEKTVDRHVSNIFGKLEVATRAAATAFAYEHGLI